MTDETSRAADETAGPVGGERLAEARRLRQMSLPDIARELHIDETKVQALEENRFEVLGAPVFAKGHLRKYAGIVGVPVDDVLADYYALNRSAGAPPIVGPPRKRPREWSLGPWLLLLTVLVIAAGLYWWLGRSVGPVAEPTPAVTTPAERSAPADITPQPGSREEAPAAALPPPLAAPVTATENAAAAAADSTPAAADSTPAVAERRQPAGNEVALRLVFSGDCWTEITAGDGSRLFVDLGTAGRTLNLAGVAPVRVLLGNANNVTLTVDGEPYRIADRERRGDTARLTINR